MLNEKSAAGQAVVIGAGTMGGGIAAQLANAGWNVRLLDVAGSGDRNELAKTCIERLIKNRPPFLFLPEYAARISVGNTSDDFACLEEADWVVEAIVESMDAKQALMAEIEESVGPHTVVTSNTSGLNLDKMCTNCSSKFRSNFFGTHFLNPPRYLKLLEVVATSSTSSQVLSGFVQFAESILGHRVVIAKDSPGFISTRIWIQHLLESIRLAIECEISVEEADFLTGPLLGRPRSGTFRMADIVGLDVVCAIASNQYSELPNDRFRQTLRPHQILSSLVSGGRLGEKSGEGFYKREGKEIRPLDLVTGEYRDRVEPTFPSLASVAKSTLSERLAVISADRSSREGRFVNGILDSLHAYIDYAGPLVAASVEDVDNVMRWGFQWDSGPFAIEDMRFGTARYYGTHNSEKQALCFADNSLKTIVQRPEYITMAGLKASSATVLEATEGSLLDMGDGVACLELRTKMNTFGPELCDFIDKARELAERQFLAVVIGSDAAYFSAGFNLKLFLEAVPKEDWASIDAMLKQVQATFMAIKYSRIPSVAAVRGYTLGGGCECAFSCSAIQAAPELTMGLPELPAGLIPAGGAFKELLHRTFEGWDGKSDAFLRADRAIDFIVAMPPAASAAQAMQQGLLRETDSVSRNADRLLYDAKQKALALANSEYVPPVKKGVWAVGADGLARMRMACHQHCSRNPRITAHDRFIADRAMYVMSGGPLSAAQEVSEEYMLNLERQVFLTLVREPKSIERIKHLLETGKPLGN